MKKQLTGQNVFDAALSRLRELYAEGNRLVVSFSGGKDSTALLELTILAAKAEGRLPVEVALRDEEIMLPGTYAYAERVAARPEVDFKWFWAEHPVPNVLDRECPFWWAYDPLYKGQWLKQPPVPPLGVRRPSLYMHEIVTAEHYKQPVLDAGLVECDHCGAEERVPFTVTKYACAGCGAAHEVAWDEDDRTALVCVLLGMRASESSRRKLGVVNMGGHLAQRLNHDGTLNVWPIYDWEEGDVWKAIRDHKWDYNRAYTDMVRAGWPRHLMRVASITISSASCTTLTEARKVWPNWFAAVCERVHGVRDLGVVRSAFPKKYPRETYREFYQRTCIDMAPAWVAERAKKVQSEALNLHARHATTPFPEHANCVSCSSQKGSWMALAKAIYGGDPFALSFPSLGPVDPARFREVLKDRLKGGRTPTINGRLESPRGRDAEELGQEEHSPAWEPR